MKTSAAATTFAVAAMAPMQAMANLPELAGFVAEVAGNIAQIVEEATSKRDISFSDKKMALSKRQDGVADEEFDRCTADLEGLTITVNTETEGALEIRGVPASCMNLANVLVGEGEGPFATPCGSDCLSYSDLSEEEINDFVSIFN